ncbi:MAG: FCD domain-containing protein [Streptosporangiales bacterium]|nr:FCD domain-containing protein [Streptosporangiales bacterium]
MAGLPHPGQPALGGLGDTVTSYLRDAILAGHLQDGQRIVERDVAEILGVSRGPVRDALRQLEAEGLVVSSPRRGSHVASLTPDAGLEIMAIRAVVEPLAVSFLLQPQEEQHFEALHDILTRLRTACEQGDWSQAVQQDFALHRQLYVLCGRRRLLRIWDDLGAPLLHIFRLNRHLYDDIGQVYDNHAALVAAIEGGDSERAERAIKEHVTMFQPRLLELMAIRNDADDEGS